MGISISASKVRDRNTIDSSAWPDSTNTGWARTGVSLTTYSGTRFWNNAGAITIDSKSIAVGDALQAFGSTTLTITRSLVNTAIDISYPAVLVIEDCNVNGGATSSPVIGYDNLTVRRCDVTGGQHSVMCGSFGLIEDNYLHDNYNDPLSPDGYHNNSYISNGGQDVTLRHNTFKCDTTLTANGGGPSANTSIFGDFGTLDNFLFDNNLYMPTTGSWGMFCGWDPPKPFGDNPTNIVVTNNVFMRGTTGVNAVNGPVTSFKAAGTGNVWTNNRFDNGTLIVP